MAFIVKPIRRTRRFFFMRTIRVGGAREAGYGSAVRALPHGEHGQAQGLSADCSGGSLPGSLRELPQPPHPAWVRAPPREVRNEHQPASSTGSFACAAVAWKFVEAGTRRNWTTLR